MPSEPRSVVFDNIAFLANSEARLTVLQTLDTAPRTHREVAAATDISPGRVNSILDELDARHWIVAVDGTYRLTDLGTRVVEGFGTMLETLAVERELRPVMPYFPTAEVTFEVRRLRGAEVVRSTASEPERPLHRLANVVRASSHLQLVSDHVPPVLLAGVWQAIVQGKGTLEAVVSADVVDTKVAEPELAAKFQDLLKAAETTVSVSDDVSLSVVIVDDTVGIVLTDETRTPRAVIFCTDERVRQWAGDTIQTYRDDAEPLDSDAFTV